MQGTAVQRMRRQHEYESSYCHPISRPHYYMLLYQVLYQELKKPFFYYIWTACIKQIPWYGAMVNGTLAP